VKLCAEYDVPIFYDGSYDQLILEGKQIDFRKIARDKIPFIYGSSLSKDFSYTGARIGWVAFHGDKWSEVKNAFFLLCNQRLSVMGGRTAAVAMVDPLPAVYYYGKKKLLERRDICEDGRNCLSRSSRMAVLRIYKDRNGNGERTLNQHALREGCLVWLGSEEDGTSGHALPERKLEEVHK
jgi:aspartate/methionine/tyrosine aminotransferase